MPTITPISNLINSIRDIKDEEHPEKAEAMIQLLRELNAGIRSVEEEGWISEEELRKHSFH